MCGLVGVQISPVLGLLHGLVADRTGEKGGVPLAGPKRVVVVRFNSPNVQPFVQPPFLGKHCGRQNDRTAVKKLEMDYTTKQP